MVGICMENDVNKDILNQLYISNKLKKVELELIMMEHVEKGILLNEDAIQNCEILQDILEKDYIGDKYENK